MEDRARFDAELDAGPGEPPAPFTEEEEASAFMGLMNQQMPGRVG